MSISPNTKVTKSISLPIKGKNLYMQNLFIYSPISINVFLRFSFDYFFRYFFSLGNVFQLVNSSKIRPESEGIGIETQMTSIRISRSASQSCSLSNLATGSYYFSFANKDNSFLENLCPYLTHSVGAVCINPKQAKNISKISNGGNENDYEASDDDNPTKVSLSFILLNIYCI